MYHRGRVLRFRPGGSIMIKEGQKAPDFKRPSSEGGEVALKDLRSRTVGLYFYPKDDTPGCTREAWAFRDRQAAINEEGGGGPRVKVDGHADAVLRALADL